MSNKSARFSSQPLIPQRLAPQTALSANSPFSSPSANLHLRQPPHLDAPRNALLYHHLRRLAITTARRNPSLRQRNGPCATAICARATRPPRNLPPALSPSPPLPVSPSPPLTPGPFPPFHLLCDPLRLCGEIRSHLPLSPASSLQSPTSSPRPISCASPPGH